MPIGSNVPLSRHAKHLYGRCGSGSQFSGVEQVGAPLSKPAPQTVKVLTNEAVACEHIGVEQLRLRERLGEHASFEGDVRALGEFEEPGPVVATRPQHCIDVYKVRGVGALVE